MSSETVTVPPPPVDDPATADTLVMPPIVEDPALAETVVAPPREGAHAEIAETVSPKDKSLQIEVVDISHGVAANAIDNADAHIAEQSSQRGFKGFLKRIWHGAIARDFIHQREVRHGREEIIESGNIYVLQEGSLEEHESAMADVVTRFSQGFLHGQEQKRALAEIDGGDSLENELKVLVNFYARGHIDEATLTQEKNRVLREFGRQRHQQDRDKGLLFADNVLEVAQNARAAFNHGVGLDRIDAAIKANVGDAMIGQRTEAKRELTDRIIDKLHSTPVGSLVNETTLSIVASAVITAGRFTTRKAVTAGAAVIGIGVGAGVLAGAREHAKVGQERKQHAREMAVGQEIDPDHTKRREQMEETRYETVSATELTDRLAAARDAVAEADPATIDQALAAITEAQIRNDLSDTEAIDLIDFTGVSNLERERLLLDITLAEAKVAVRRSLESHSEDELGALGLSHDLDSLIVSRSEGVTRLIRQDMGVKDSAFNKLRRNRTAKMAAVGFVSGVLIGDAIQEARALVGDDLQGIFEPHDNQADRRTLLAGIFGYGGATHNTSVSVHDLELSKHASLKLPEGYSLVDSSNGGHNLVDSSGKVVVDHFTLNDQGHITEATRHALEASGFNLTDHGEDYISSHIEHSHVTRSASEYLHHHPNEFTKVHRELWYDNNTPSVFDQNELRLWWGGSNGTGIDAHGNYVFNIQQMQADGSFHDGLSADAQRLVHEGKMAIALSMTKDTQSHVIMVPIDKHGNAVIHAHSWMAKSLFESKGGQAHFRGAYAEAVQLMGKHNGTESTRMLATVVGDNDPHRIRDTVTHHVHENIHRIVTELQPKGEKPIEIPPVLPIYSRRGLERLRGPIPEFNYIAGPDYIRDGYRASEGLLPRDGLAPYSPELRESADAKIDSEKAARRYIRAMNPTHKKVVEKLAKSLDKEPKASRPKVVVMIPAAAHQEGKNIFNTLLQYSHQQGVGKEDFEVVIFANYPKGSKPDSTINEVKRFKKEHPELKVRLITKELERDEAKIGWIRKAVTDSVISDLLERGIPLDEVMLVSNDADSEWINPNYIQTIVGKAEANPDTDGFLGFIDWSYDAYKAHPDVLVGTRFMQMIDIYLRVSRHEVASSGANFAFRPGIYTAIGGYQQDNALGEDVVLGRMIKSVRAGAGTRRPISFLGRSSEVNTSARRALEKLLKDGGAPVTQWDQEFGANDELRNREFDLTAFNFDDPEAVTSMVRSCERMLNQTLGVYRSFLADDEPKVDYHSGRLTDFNAETIRQINRMGFFLGVTLQIQPDGTLRIVDASKLLQGLREWQAKH